MSSTKDKLAELKARRAAAEEELKKMEMGKFPEGTSQERKVCDSVASMTDRYALNLYEEIFFPKPLV